jgi:hypothetical protein
LFSRFFRGDLFAFVAFHWLQGVLDWLIALRERRAAEVGTGGTHFIAGNHDFAMGAFLGCEPFDSSVLGSTVEDLDATLPRFKALLSEAYESGEDEEEGDGGLESKAERTGMHFQGRRWGGTSGIYDADSTWASYVRDEEPRELSAACASSWERSDDASSPLQPSNNSTCSSSSSSSSSSASRTTADSSISSSSRRRQVLLDAVPTSHKAFLASLDWCVDLRTPFQPGRLLAVHAGLDPSKSADAQVAALKRRDFRDSALIDRDPGRLEVRFMFETFIQAAP